MIRRNIVMALLAALLGVVAFAPGAVAQGDDDTEDETHGEIIATQQCSYNNTCPKGPNTTVPDGQGYDPGNVADAFASSDGPSADVIPQIQPTPVPAADAAADVQAPQLAFTGAETDVLTWVGSGMIAAGALALVARRRLTD